MGIESLDFGMSKSARHSDLAKNPPPGVVFSSFSQDVVSKDAHNSVIPPNKKNYA